MNSIDNIANSRILFSPLNWGMGHVSRSIPLLKKLQLNNEIIIACDKKQRAIYEEYLVDVQYIDWKGYPFNFKGKGNFGKDLLLSFRKLYRFGKYETKLLASIIENEKISLVLSDHRYFFRSEKIPSVFISHQINLCLPWYFNLAQILHRKYLNRFDQIWIVDNETASYAGKLSAKESRSGVDKILYLGPLSRFDNLVELEKKWTTVLVSGPEPYAEQFYKSQRSALKVIPENYCIIYRGVCEDKHGKRAVSWREIDTRLSETKNLIARSGYSTIMDVDVLGCETEWHPTTGQWEQEYLAKRHS